jgi:beta-glucosidase
MYRDSSQPLEARVADLLGRMTVEEKVAQLYGVMPISLLGPEGIDPDKLEAQHGDGLGQVSMLSMLGDLSPEALAEAINGLQRFFVEHTRLGIPVIPHNEALNGLVAKGATNFPTAIGLAATWEPELIQQMTDVIRRQMRAVGVRQALSPVFDVARDPRWGRVHETYGEDPCLCSAMGVAFVRGLQGEDLKDGIVATGKHFLGYGLTEGGLNCAATHLGQRELYEVFARPFEAAIREAGLASIMNSYSEIDGIPCGASSEVLTELLRGRMGFTGMVVSDYFTVRRLVGQFHIAADLQDAAVQALEAGVDVELPHPTGYNKLTQAVNTEAVGEGTLDRAVRRVLECKFRLGLFDAPYVDVEQVRAAYDDPAHRALSRRLANKSLVLLKNEGALLPLSKDVGVVAVIGPHADSVRSLFANYTYPAAVEMIKARMLQREAMASMEGAMGEGGMSMDADTVQGMLARFQEVLEAEDIEAYIKANYPARSVLEAIQDVISEGTRVLYAQGCEVVGESTDGFAAAVDAAQQADVAVLVLGDRSGWFEATTGEGKDRSSLALPGVQQQLLEAIAAVGVPVVLVLVNGRPLAVNWAADHVPAIVEAWYPGQEGGDAIAGVLFGDFNPGGKLPVTIPRTEGQVPIYHYHKMGSGYQRSKENTLTEYTDIPLTPLYPFGFGLSYTTFEYGNLRLSTDRVDSRGAVEVSCDVTNTGQIAGEEVVQLYLRDREARVTRPVQELAGFKRVGLEPGATCKVTFRVEMRQLGFYDRQMRFVVEPGNMDVMIGSSSADIHLTGAFEIVGDVVEVMGNRAFLSEARVTG